MHDLKEVLAAHPEFSFDLGEHCEALAARDALSERWQCFLDWRSGGRSAYGSPRQRLSEWLSSEPAYEVPAYANCQGSVSRLPFIDREEVRSRGPDFISRALAGGKLWRRSTSGTSGAPVSFFFDRDRHFEQLLLAVPKIAVRAGIVEALQRPVLCLHLTDTQSGRCTAYADPLNEFGVMLRGRIDQSDPNALPRVAEWVSSLRPAVITARPEIYAVALTEPAMREALQAQPPDLLVSSGSELSPTLRTTLGEEVGAPISVAYGLCEFGVVASTCAVCGQMHLDDPALILEQGGKVPDEAVISGLGNAAMPLLRYRTGDRIEVGDQVCSAAAPGPSIASVIGRVVPPFRFSGGRVFSPTHFTNLPNLFPIQGYQLTQLDSTSVELSVDPAPAAVGSRGLLRRLRLHLKAGLPQDIAVEVRSVRFGTRKISRFRSLCDEGF